MDTKSKTHIRECDCGCGESFSSSSHCRKYVKGHVNRDVWIPMDEFRSALARYKEANDITWKELAIKSGYTYRGLSSIMYGDQAKIRKSRVTEMFTRLGGGSLEPTDAQKATYTLLARKVQSEMRAETLKDNNLKERKAKVAKLREQLS